MSLFFNKNKPKYDNYGYENEQQKSVIERYMRFPVFVGLALALVVIVVVVMFCLNLSNNAFAMFNHASSKNFDCGSFSYQVNAGINDNTYMSYDGVMEFDLDDQMMKSCYHAQYEDYEYDSVVYAKGVDAYRGNYYGGKWTVENYTDRALDFFDFYRDYRKGDFDAGAAVRFTHTNDVFNAVQLNASVENIIKELTDVSNANNVLHQTIVTDSNGTKVTFNPEMDKLFDLIMDDISSAYASANMYNELKADIDNSRMNLESADVTVSYSINDDGYLSSFLLSYTIDEETYTIDVQMNGFAQSEAEIPDSFFTAAGID